ncbi:MAG: DUF4394 domain-containing protein [Elainellaceae cyanobacterium]
MMERFIALTDNNALVVFDPSNLAQSTSIPITGIEGTLLGIDTRPADHLVYGITTANTIYTIDPDGFDSGSFDGTFVLTEEEEAFLLSDALYINLHTNTFNGGELRGQVDIELENDVAAFGLPLEESQEVGDVVPPDSPATASFDIIYDDATNALTITGTFSDLTSPLFPVGPEADIEGNPQSAIHLHNGVAGENGPIIRNFTVSDDGRFEGAFTLTDEEEALLLNDALYINLHTDIFNGGELRGQVDIELENDIVANGIPIEETQEVGDVVPPDSPAMGAFSIVYDDASNNLTTSGDFSDLTSPLFPIGPAADVEGNPQSAIHLHNGGAGENGPIIRNLNTTDNVAAFVSTLSQPFEGGTISGFDFNPVADRLRLVGDNDQNFRINVDTGDVNVDGTLTFANGDRNDGINPNITASAYTNSFAGTTSTELYNIDTLLNTLVLQNPPNDGTLVTVGELGIDFDTLGGFDIVSSSDGTNSAFAVSDATLYSIDLNTGTATNLGLIGDEAGLNLQGLVALSNPMVEEMPDSGTGQNPDLDNLGTGSEIEVEFDDLVGYVGVGLLDAIGEIDGIAALIDDAGDIFDEVGDIFDEVDLSTLDDAFQQLGITVADVAEMGVTFPGVDGAAVGDLLQTDMSGAIA